MNRTPRRWPRIPRRPTSYIRTSHIRTSYIRTSHLRVTDARTSRVHTIHLRVTDLFIRPFGTFLPRNALCGILFLCVLPLVAACGSDDAIREPGTPTGPAAGERSTPRADSDIEEFLRGYYDALSDRDWERFTDHFHDGAHIAFVMPDSTGSASAVTIQSVPEFVSLAPLGPGSRQIFEERMTTHAIHVEGDLAVGWVGYEARFGDPGDVMEWTGTDAITMIRTEDRWRITSLAYVPEL